MHSTPPSSLAKRGLFAVSTALWCASSVACGGASRDEEPSAGATTVVGSPLMKTILVVLREPDSGDLDDVGISGSIVFDHGCIYVDGPAGARSVIAWPHGTRWNPATQSIERPGGLEPFNDPAFALAIGDYFSAAGTTQSRAEVVVDLSPDSAESLDRCLEGDVAVVRARVRNAEPPSWVPTPTTSTEPAT
jgi:hypothetical protein